ncbi:MAG: HAD family hydrolase [Lachnospiraceae bacterium]|nr:HAD family hydrolase [Lachnospiraceae bacterium]
MGYFDYEKKSEYLVCIDSDGCAMDTMEVKHRECFGPQWIYTYGLGAHFEEYMKIWLDINLYSITRGINRFKGLALALQEVEKQGDVRTGGLDEFVKWTEEAKELSNPALLALAQKSNSECIEKALLWSIRTNRSINNLPADDKPFDNVKVTMDAMCKAADLVAVSSANGEAVEAEWTKHQLKEDCRVLLCQEAGSKAFCIGELMKKGYDPAKILMVGDAPGDRDAAMKNGVRYYPILVGKEGESWTRLKEEAFPKLLAGTFDDEYQAMLIREFEQNLGV